MMFQYYDFLRISKGSEPRLVDRSSVGKSGNPSLVDRCSGSSAVGLNIFFLSWIIVSILIRKLDKVFIL